MLLKLIQNVSYIEKDECYIESLAPGVFVDVLTPKVNFMPK